MNAARRDVDRPSVPPVYVELPEKLDVHQALGESSGMKVLPSSVPVTLRVGGAAGQDERAKSNDDPHRIFPAEMGAGVPSDVCFRNHDPDRFPFVRDDV